MLASDLDLHELPALALAEAIQRREVTARQVAIYFLDRIERASVIKAYSEITAERALAQAEAADRLQADGIILGPLHGVPIAIKDHLQWEGASASLGSMTRRRYISTGSSAVVRTVIAQGMVILGKTRMTEFAFGLSGQNPTQGTARNPWDAAHMRAPGGSSSGSGVAVAAGLAALALGGDSGGSVRAPAALNSLVGFKPSSGVISRACSLPLSETLDVLGTITRTVSDSHALTRILSGPDPDDKATLAFPALSLTALRAPLSQANGAIAVLSPEEWPVKLSREAQANWDSSLQRLIEAGYLLERWRPPVGLDFGRISDDNSIVLGYEGFRHYGALAQDPNQPLWGVVRARIIAGAAIETSQYCAALARRVTDQMLFAQAMRGYAVLLMPACDQAAQILDVEDVRHTGLGKLLRPANFLDAPSIVLPSGLDSDGMPLSVQLLASSQQDAVLLNCAAELEPVLAPEKAHPNLTVWGL